MDLANEPEAVIEIQGLTNRFGRGPTIHDGLDLTVRRGEILGVVGGSGTGKSVLLRTIVGLNKKRDGTIHVLGHDMDRLRRREREELIKRWGVLFQFGALFTSLTVEQNIAITLKEHTDLSPATIADLAALKIDMVGLPADAAHKYPSELSGGMKKRAGLARALALDPEILFLDEPTSGLDPIGAGNFDMLIRDLQRSLNLTVFMVTHDLDSLVTITDRIAVLVDKRVKVGTLSELVNDEHPWIREYFHGPRGKVALGARAGGG